MGISEADFWKSTPKKIIALIDQKKEIEKIKQKNLAIYIASYVWGNDPDKNETDKKSQRKIKSSGCDYAGYKRSGVSY